uniref:Pre-mRNA-splicing factor 38 n=1 Tax=Anopheles melas TaxID=34690 RepID=A0A182U7Q8_9DIPT
MANRTVKDAKNVHGTNPQYLIEKIIRSRIYDSKYWKEQCFALTAELLVDKAMELRFVGGVFGGNIKPTPFLCLTLKMLQIQPEKDIVVEFIKNEEFKYVRALGAFYLRLTGSSLDCYKYLEPLYNDNRKLRKQNRMGAYELIHMDEFIDELLREERVCDIILPRIQKRHVLEENNELEPKVSALEDDLDEEMPSEDEAVEDLPPPPPAAKEKKIEAIKAKGNIHGRVLLGRKPRITDLFLRNLSQEQASAMSVPFQGKGNRSIGTVTTRPAIIMIEKMTATKNVDVSGNGSETEREIGTGIEIAIAIETVTERWSVEIVEIRTMRGIASKSVNFEIGNEKDSGAMSGRRSVSESDAENGIEIGIANTKNDPAAMTASVITTESEEDDEINRKHKPNKRY